MISEQSEDTMECISQEMVKGYREVLFASYLKKDYVARALTLNIDSNAVIQIMRFQSNEFGIAIWSNGQGFHQANVWEDEDAAIDPESLKRFRYPLLNGAVSIEVARKTIVADVVDYLPGKNLSSLIKNISVSQSWPAKFDLGLIQFSKRP